jgi:hypothetical protein
MDQVIGIMLVIVLIGVLADKLLFSPWDAFSTAGGNGERLANAPLRRSPQPGEGFRGRCAAASPR